jgi:hypothetical protein
MTAAMKVGNDVRHALVIRPPWIDKIPDGKITWEIHCADHPGEPALLSWTGLSKKVSFSNGKTFRGNFIQSVAAPIK